MKKDETVFSSLLVATVKNGDKVEAKSLMCGDPGANGIAIYLAMIKDEQLALVVCGAADMYRKTGTVRFEGDAT